MSLEQEAIGTLLGRAVEGIIFVESKHRSPTQELERSQKPYMFVHRLFAAGAQFRGARRLWRCDVGRRTLTPFRSPADRPH